MGFHYIIVSEWKDNDGISYELHKYLVMKVNRLSFSKAKNECDRNCAPNHGNASNGGVSLSLCIYAKIN